ncbi:MAG: hypothetical protein K2K55_06570 [Duncaniella sp.]|nr:hypothetical protein [Duncaniella sp.]
MASILLWTGIVLIVAGWLALSWQAFKAVSSKKELEKFPEKKHAMTLRRNYCRFAIIAGIALLILSLTVK